MTQLPIAALIAAARSGRLICFPTDTVPALAVRPDQATQIFAAKQRPTHKPLILMAAHANAIGPFVQGSDQDRQDWQQLADTHWPGALTLVLPASDQVPKGMNPHNPHSIGVRVPNAFFAQMILQQTGPLATTSINHSGQPALTTLADIQHYFPQVFTPLANQWSLPGEGLEPIPSTVVKWTGQDWDILRQGALYLETQP